MSATANPRRRCSASTVFTLAFIAFVLTAFFAYAYLLSLFNLDAGIAGPLAALMTFDWFLVETLVVLIAGFWLMTGNRFSRYLAYALLFAALAVHIVQIASLYRTSALLSRLAVENIESLSLVLDLTMIAVVGIAFAIILQLPIHLETRPYPRANLARGARLTAIFATLALFAGSSAYWLPEEIAAQRRELLRHNRLPYLSPAFQFVQVLRPPRPGTVEMEPNAVDLELAKTFGFNLDPDRPYPLVKNFVYEGLTPFPQIEGAVRHPDILVFFGEGVSTRVLGPYGAPYPELTPNLDRFAQSAMRFDDYFGHTAATYRGLLGQLCSLFPTYGGTGGWKERPTEIIGTHFFCLNHALREHGYRAVFVDGNRNAYSWLNEMMVGLDFDTVWWQERLSRRLLKGAEPAYPHALGDQQLADALIAMFRRRRPLDDSRTPIFTGAYTIGNHVWQSVPAGGKKYGDGQQPALNRIHNLDHAFGKFWDYFLASPHAKTTIVIFTTDHAPIPDSEFLAIAGENAPRSFISRIPLLIYDPTRKLPRSIDAHNATSLDFTPTLLHHLDLENLRNPFLGKSIYDHDLRASRGEPDTSVAEFSDQVFIIDDDGVHRHGFTNRHTEELGSLHRFIRKTHELEVDNRIWPPREE